MLEHRAAEHVGLLIARDIGVPAAAAQDLPYGVLDSPALGRLVPRRPLALYTVTTFVLLGLLVVGFSSTGDLVRATSACFIAVYLLAVLSAARILTGRLRAVALFTLATVVGLAVFSSWFLAVPIVAAVLSVALRQSLRSRQESSLRMT